MIPIHRSIIILPFFISLILKSQSGFNVRADFSFWGVHQGYQFDRDGEVLRRKAHSYYTNSVAFQLKLNYRIRQSWGFDLILQRAEQDISVYDKYYFDRHDIDRKEVESTHDKQDIQGHAGAYRHYLGAGLGVIKYFNFRKVRNAPDVTYIPNKFNDEHFYFSAGLLYNKVENTDVYTYRYTDKDREETLTLSTLFVPKYVSCFAELGYYHNGHATDVYFGLRYSWSGGGLATADYEYRGRNNVLLATDRVNVANRYLALTVSIGPRLTKYKEPQWRNENKDLVDKVPVPNIISESSQETDSARELAGADTTGEKGGIYKDRAVNVAHRLGVSKDSVVVLIWDKGVVDGDKVSLYLNGELIYADLELTAAKVQIVLKLKPGSNELLMYVEDEGRIRPCTAALIINAGSEKHSLSLSSSKSSSGSIVLER